MSSYDSIKKYWNDLSTASGNSYKASWDDFYMRQKEIDTICSYIQDGYSICDFGCNNGYCVFKLAERFKINVLGIDYAEKAIAEANAELARNGFKDIAFIVGDMLDKKTYPNERFDRVVIKRTLINLNSDKDQIQALKNIACLLKPGGKIILTEAVEENWLRLNTLRTEFGLGRLEQPWHNHYISDDVLKFIKDHFDVLVDNDYSSSYYVVSRVINPWINKGQKVNYLSELNRLATQLPNIGDYGIQRLFVLANYRD